MGAMIVSDVCLRFPQCEWYHQRGSGSRVCLAFRIALSFTRIESMKPDGRFRSGHTILLHKVAETVGPQYVFFVC
jgi:hypothetical protein